MVFAGKRSQEGEDCKKFAENWILKPADADRWARRLAGWSSQGERRDVFMRYLTLMRHAKSDWDNPDLDDHERPLNARGNRAAPAMSKVLATKYFGSSLHGIPKPDCLISSTAVRARATAGYLADALRFSEDDIDLEPGLYEASAADILDVIKELPEEFEHAVLIGHNPGMQSCAEQLLGFGEDAEEIGNLATCGTVMMRLPVDFWALIDTGSAELVDHLFPKMIGLE